MAAASSVHRMRSTNTLGIASSVVASGTVLLSSRQEQLLIRDSKLSVLWGTTVCGGLDSHFVALCVEIATKSNLRERYCHLRGLPPVYFPHPCILLSTDLPRTLP